MKQRGMEPGPKIPLGRKEGLHGRRFCGGIGSVGIPSTTRRAELLATLRRLLGFGAALQTRYSACGIWGTLGIHRVRRGQGAEGILDGRRAGWRAISCGVLTGLGAFWRCPLALLGL